MYISVHTAARGSRASFATGLNQKKKNQSWIAKGLSLAVPLVIQLIVYGVATVSRIDEIIGLFYRILSVLYGSFAKETYNLIDPTT